MPKFDSDLKAQTRLEIIRTWGRCARRRGKPVIPAGWQFISLCNDQTGAEPNSELNQLCNLGFIQKSQYVGIDHDGTLIKANRAAHPESTWLEGDFVSVLRECERTNCVNGQKWRPAVIFYDSFDRVSNQRAAETMAHIMPLCPPSSLLVGNFLITDPYSNGRPLDANGEADRAFRKLIVDRLGADYCCWEQQDGWEYTSKKTVAGDPLTVMRSYVFLRDRFTQKNDDTSFLGIGIRQIPAEPRPPVNRSIRTLWKHQEQARRESHGKRFFEICFPPRDGKTQTQQAIAADHYLQDYTQKSLALAPMRLTAKGFKDSKFLLDGRKIHWTVYNQDNLCEDSSVQIKRTRLVGFLQRKGPIPPPKTKGKLLELSRFNAIATYSVLADFWKYDDHGKERTHEEQLDLIQSPMFRDLTIWLDEFHHVRGVAREDAVEVSVEERNIIGDLVTYGIHHGYESLRFGLMSGTPYNSTCIADDMVRRQFFKCTPRTLMESLQKDDCEIEEITTSRIYYNNPVEKLASIIAKSPKGHHLVVLPPEGCEWRTNRVHSTFHKIEDVLRLLTDALRKQAPWVSLLDATPNNPKNGDRLAEMQGTDGATLYDYNVVVVCRRGRESLDWLPCDHLHITYLQSEIWETIQTICRPLSSYPGKKEVSIYFYLPDECDPSNLTKTRVQTIVMQLQLAELCHPVRHLPAKSTEPAETELAAGQDGNFQLSPEQLDSEIRSIAEVANGFGGKAVAATVTRESVAQLLLVHPELQNLPNEDLDRLKEEAYTRVIRLLRSNFGISLDYVHENFRKFIGKAGQPGQGWLDFYASDEGKSCTKKPSVDQQYQDAFRNADSCQRISVREKAKLKSRFNRLKREYKDNPDAFVPNGTSKQRRATAKKRQRLMRFHKPNVVEKND